MKKVDLNNLPLKSAWPARLLGLSPWTAPTRTEEKVDKEYDKDKYAKCLAYYTSEGMCKTPGEIRAFEGGASPTDTVWVSFGNDIYETSVGEMRAERLRIILDAMRSELAKCRSVVELGCGYGYNLWRLKEHFPDKMFVGGEYSRNAVELAAHLYKNDSRVRVVHFNFYDRESYRLLQGLEQPIAIMTVHAIEQLPSCSAVIDALAQYRDTISSVFHFEPLYELHDDTLLGMMRRRYCIVNDYNRDLLTELKRRPYIHIQDLQVDNFGMNPLNPSSIVHWKFIRQ